MKYIEDSEARKLFSNDGKLLKKLSCPLNKNWDELHSIEGIEVDSLFRSLTRSNELKRHCWSCNKNVVNISSFNDDQVIALLEVNPELCIYASKKSKHIEFTGEDAAKICPPEEKYGMPVIQTARTISAINDGALNGFWPLIKPVIPSDEIYQKILVRQNDDGTIETSSDYRSGYGGLMTGLRYYYNPYTSPLPFAAYLIPKDLPSGTKVFLPDLIEDIVGMEWNQGDKYRRNSGYAVWDGKDLILDHEDVGGIMG